MKLPTFGASVQIQDFSTFHEYTTFSWGDGTFDTIYAGQTSTLLHHFSEYGNYSVQTQTIACNDTLRNSYLFEYKPSTILAGNLLLFPNPNDGNFQLWLNSEKLWQLEVFDASGRIVFEKSDVVLNTGFNLNLSELESAIYFVKIRSEQATFMERVLISK